MDRIKEAVLFGFAIGILVLIAYTIRHSLLAIYISCIFAIVLTPAVQSVCKLRIGRYHPSRGVAILLLVAAVVLAFTILLLVALPPLVNDLQQLISALPQDLKKLQKGIHSIPLLGRIDGSRINGYLQSLLSAVPSAVTTIGSTVASILGVAVLTAYLILEGDRVFGWFLRLFPVQKRERVKSVSITAADRMRKWLLGQAILMLILGAASTIAFGFIGVRYFYLLGVIAGIANFVPLLGPILTVLLAGLVAALDSWTKLLGVVIFYFVYQQIENAYLTPKIMKSQVNLSGSAVLSALLIGAELAGIPGAVVAVPSAVLISVLIDSFLMPKNQSN